MTGDDLRAIVTYLRGIPALPDGSPETPSELVAVTSDALGEKLFAQACAGCHLPDGTGRQSPWAALAGSHATTDPEGTNLIQALTQGSEIRTKEGVMFMHPFTGAYTDGELAAIANYAQRQFGRRRGAITPAMVAKQRQAEPNKPGKPSS